MNPDTDIIQAKPHVNTVCKRSRLDTTIGNTDESLVDLKNMVADQVVLDILMEVLEELNGLMTPYAKVMSPLLDISAEEIDDDGINVFLERHKPRLADMKIRHQTVKNRIQRLSSNESKISNALIQRSAKAN